MLSYLLPFAPFAPKREVRHFTIRLALTYGETHAAKTMADAGDICPYCERHLKADTHQGRAIHIGKCRANQRRIEMAIRFEPAPLANGATSADPPRKLQRARLACNSLEL